MTTNIRFEDWEAEQLRDPEFREAAKAYELAYQVARLRMLRGLTQEELAERVGTRQPSIARLESGKTEPRLSFLRRVARALKAQIKVQLVPDEQAVPAAQERRSASATRDIFITVAKTHLDRGDSHLWSTAGGPRVLLDLLAHPASDQTQIIPVPDWPVSGSVRWIDDYQETVEFQGAGK